MKASRPIIANFFAPLIALMPITIISLHALVVSDPLDDAPLKSSTFFFMAFPSLYFIILVFSHFYGKFLLSFGFIPLKKLLISTAIGILLLVIPFAFLFSNPDKYGIKDAYFAYATIAGLILKSALPSAAFWWYMVCKPLRKAT